MKVKIFTFYFTFLVFLEYLEGCLFSILRLWFEIWTELKAPIVDLCIAITPIYPSAEIPAR